MYQTSEMWLEADRGLKNMVEELWNNKDGSVLKDFFTQRYMVDSLLTFNIDVDLLLEVLDMKSSGAFKGRVISYLTTRFKKLAKDMDTEDVK